MALFSIPIFADCRKTANRQAPVAPPAPVKTIALLRVVCVFLYVYALLFTMYAKVLMVDPFKPHTSPLCNGFG